MRMGQVAPWDEPIGVLKPFYPSGEHGRPPIGLERMLRLYFLQQWYGLTDEALDDAACDGQATRLFLGIQLGSDPVPDATTLLGFHRLLEANGLCSTIFEAINRHPNQRADFRESGLPAYSSIVSISARMRSMRRSMSSR